MPVSSSDNPQRAGLGLEGFILSDSTVAAGLQCEPSLGLVTCEHGSPSLGDGSPSLSDRSSLGSAGLHLAERAQGADVRIAETNVGLRRRDE